jgi:hypothetical protein
LIGWEKVQHEIGRDGFSERLAFYSGNIILAVAFFTLGTILGRVFYWYRWERSPPRNA